MAQTITITEEAQAFFVQNPDPALKALVDLGVKEYGAFMGGLPMVVDAFEEEGSDRIKVSVGVEADAACGELGNRYHEFMNGWRSRHGREARRAIGFAIRYL